MPNKPMLSSKFILPFLLLLVSNSALSSAVYSVHLKKKLNGAKIFAEINKVNAPGSLTILKLSNFGEQTVACKANFDPRIEQKKSFKRLIKPNKDVSIRYTTARTPNRLNVELICRPLKARAVTTDSDSRPPP